jgi:hypothetical protein
VGLKEILEQLPCVEVEEHFEEVIANPLEYVKVNENYFKNSLESIATYSIHKGREKGEYVVLFIGASVDGSPAQHKPYFGVYVTGSGEQHGIYPTIEEAVEKFKQVLYKYESQLVYRVYEAKLKDEDEMIRFCISSMRELAFIEEVKNGQKLIELDSMRLIYETEDRNEARSLATEF